MSALTNNIVRIEQKTYDESQAKMTTLALPPHHQYEGVSKDNIPQPFLFQFSSTVGQPQLGILKTKGEICNSHIFCDRLIN